MSMKWRVKDLNLSRLVDDMDQWGYLNTIIKFGLYKRVERPLDVQGLWI
jgi:hypothetical protein